MSGNFEKIALEIIKTYLDCKKEQNNLYKERGVGMYHDFQYDPHVCDPYIIQSTVQNIADNLSQNAMRRILKYDEEAYDRQVVKLLEGENNVN